MPAALAEQRRAAAGQAPLQHPAMHRVRRFPDRALALQVADDDARGLRGQRRDPRQIGAGQAGMAAEQAQNRKLRRRHADLGERPFQRQPGRGLGLPQQRGELGAVGTLARAGKPRAEAAESWIGASRLSGSGRFTRYLRLCPP